ncbi:MAG: bifunctional dihydroorotate dehydrogenase B NAD binding subunit/NADPH-dependent glutamate synthase [Bacteroidales bacterium]|nr:bifunctional dihydroorotate dehydrogenase B NAD binding subunit/NADPH-dependent glutamate synthase [Bacteroidales bacterium]
MATKRFEILEKETLAPEIISMQVYAPRLAASAKPGQFLIVIPDQKGERIPLTVCDYDLQRGTIRIVFQMLGDSTKHLGRFEVGECFEDVVGPLGRPSDFMEEDLNEVKKRNILFVAGGFAAAPVYPQVKWMHENGVACDVILGARSANLFVLEKEMRDVAKDVFLCTDDGSAGFHGRVTDLIKDLIDNQGKKYDQVICIGPMIMMKFVSVLTKEYNIPTVVSLNTLMVDGTGMCGACRVTVGGKTRFACVDGPEFDAHQVDFDEAMRRQGMYRHYEIARNTEEHHCNLASAVEESAACRALEKGAVPEGFDKKKRVPVREQDPVVRSGNFEEVCLGYNEDEAVLEASRCLQCKKPACMEACPVSIKIPQFIAKVAERNFEEAARVIAIDSALPAVCGRVCPQESQCEGSCVMGKKFEAVAIGKLERFVADYTRAKGGAEPEKPALNGKKVAVIGSGPAGLTCAGDLAKMGYSVSVFEALHKAGGVLVYGIPEFRLPKAIVAKEIENLKKLGVEFETDVIIGKTDTVDHLLDVEKYDAVFIGSGAGLPKFMNIPGENLNGVVSANELLTRSNLMKAYRDDYATPVFIGKRVAVVGGGNVAMDAARTAKRLGSDVYVVYRRTINEMPARKEEVHHAQEEGIHFMELNNPVEILGDEKGWVKAIRCIRMELGEPDASGRRSPVEKPGSEFDIEVDEVVMSLGTVPNPMLAHSIRGLETNRKGCVVADENGVTSRKGVFAGGDVVSGAATVILAMGAARKAAKAIDAYIQGK